MDESNGSEKTPLQDDGELFAVYVRHGATHLIKGRVHVLILNDDGSWFAQGLELDYSAEGTGLEDVQSRFEKGLASTIRGYLKRDGNITAFFEKPASLEYWKLYEAGSSKWRLIFKRKIEIASQESPSAEKLPVAQLDLEFSAEPRELAAK